MGTLSSSAVREVLRLTGKRKRVVAAAAQADVSAAEVQPLLAEIDAEIARIRALSAAQSELSLERPSKKA